MSSVSVTRSGRRGTLRRGAAARCALRAALGAVLLSALWPVALQAADTPGVAAPVPATTAVSARDAISPATAPGATHYSEQREPCATVTPLKQAFFGDLHVHTKYSLDASTQGTRTSPAQAYQFGKGERVGIQPWNEDGTAQRSLQLSRPLDFAMVSDHAELIGEVHMCNSPEVEGYNSWQCRLYRYWPRAAFYLYNYMATMQKTHLGMCGENGERCRAAALQPWREMQDAAETHYDRSAGCQFTTFMGYEWTGMDSSNGGNLHRNVVFRNAVVPKLPSSFIDTPAPHLLWNSLRDNCNENGAGCEALVIPHNSNMSAGSMFTGLDDAGQPLSRDYATAQAYYEPIAEIMQHKGASECFFQAGVTADELCAFERLSKDNIAGFNTPPTPATGFLRKVLQDGLAIEQQIGANPYRLGLIGGTDTHLGTPGAADENSFLGHGGAGVPAGEAIPPGLPDELEYNPGGLSVIWATENSRDALFDSLRRREVYGTSGPRIISRFFAGWDFPADLCSSQDRIARAYAGGVPMGSVLPPASNAAQPGAKPRFLVAASQDAGTAAAPGTPLQRVQIIKGWVDAQGERHERVVDVAGDANNGASVDLKSCQTSGKGFAELCAVWTDDDFDPQQRAFYYSRVVENPTCRWSQRMCAAAAVDCSKPDTVAQGYEGCCATAHRPVVQERAWSSPIWYSPAH